MAAKDRLAALETATQAVIASAGDAVVTVGRGTGIVVARDTVLTNAHNLHQDELTVRFGDGRAVTGRVAGADLDDDLAVVAVDTGAVEPLAVGDDPPRLGQYVVALARPRHRGLVATTGSVAAVDARFRGPRGRLIVGAFEHDARLPRGGSGGPVLDLDGRLVGIDTHRRGDGFYVAVPAAALLDRVDRLRRGEVASRPRLGIAVAPPPVARRLRAAVGLDDRDGVLVREVDPDSPAAEAGLREGDLIVAVDGKPLNSVEDLQDAVVRAGAPLALSVVRGAEEREVTIDVAAPQEGQS